MRLEAIKDKAYITSAGEKAVDTGKIDEDGHRVFEIHCKYVDFFNSDGSDALNAGDPDIIDEWPETTDAPAGHVNTAEIVYPGGEYKLVSELSVNTGDVIEHIQNGEKWTVVDEGITTEDGDEEAFLPFDLTGDKYKIVSRASKPVTQDEWGDWIGWNGGECPVYDDTEVIVVLSSGGERPPGVAGDWNWYHTGDSVILAYRTRKAPVMATVTLYGRFGGVRSGWYFNEERVYNSTHKITMVMKDGVPQSIANVEVIK